MVSIFFSRFAIWLRIGGWLALSGASAWLSGCASAPAPVIKERTTLRLQIAANENVNPNEWGTAAPILVRVYELKSPTAFQTADFFTLQSDDKKILGDDALVVDEFILRPGDTREIVRKSNPATTAIGVLAGYRDLGKSVWRAVYRLPVAPDAAWYRMALPDKEQKLTIQLDQRTVSISKSD
ncbi:type VI secretion system lipoprotein TssJ [Paraburkholderia atlantica]|uniref:Type VI secretion system protein VasD n=1 Tax=Paraburkholderia atlantica TaxID=2654982 RepID=A0A7W8PME6_PARAM|nr:type VI secretion system lipoprotein TssJ [Paraburkholderia atlantica]MBB5414508.1 type VI secretion system protein VasD [Paraburkholderia atlantica]MBB5427135.1 type VI secretion system protein VasD [Paraburkholderia atlantica]